VDYVGPAYLRSSAARKTRLISFDTSYGPNGYALKLEHKLELDKLVAFVSQTSDFSVWIVGYASKRGNHAANKTLSANRALSVEKYLKFGNPLFGDPDRLAVFDFRGDEGYIAAKDDNSADERAVEVHIFLGSPKPPPPPPHVDPPKPKPPLPGGPRFTKWEVAAPGGVFIAEVIGGGFNVFFIKNTKLNEMRGYIQPVGGVGAGLGLSGLKMAARIIQNIITGVQGSAPDFTDVISTEPVTWEEVEACLVRVSSAGAGVLKGASLAVITFSSPGVYRYGPSGVVIKEAMDLWQFTAAGEQWQVGVNASVVVGPLVRVPS
jgi:OmpA family